MRSFVKRLPGVATVKKVIVGDPEHVIVPFTSDPDDIICRFPVATEKTIDFAGTKIKRFKAIHVKKRPVGIVSKKYALRQHVSVYAPIFEWSKTFAIGYAAWITPKESEVTIYTHEANKHLVYGFTIKNSFDGRSSTKVLLSLNNISVTMYNKKLRHLQQISLNLTNRKYGTRLILDDVQTNLYKLERWKHYANTEINVKTLENVVNIMGILQTPINKTLRNAKNKKINEENVMKRYVGTKLLLRIKNKYKKVSEGNLLDLYNAINSVANNKNVSGRYKRSLLRKASEMLREETQ